LALCEPTTNTPLFPNVSVGNLLVDRTLIPTAPALQEVLVQGALLVLASKMELANRNAIKIVHNTDGTARGYVGSWAKAVSEALVQGFDFGWSCPA